MTLPRCALTALFLLPACAPRHTHPPTPPPHTATPAPLPTSTDLRPTLLALGFTPRAQGHRGTCSIFTTCAAIEFASAKATGTPTRMSPEFVNWAGWTAAGSPSDGNFFHNALAGFEQHGICAETSMPYQPSFDAAHAPTTDALAEAAARRGLLKGRTTTRWIVPWQPDHFGVTPEQFTEIKRVLALGYPVAAGSGHSRLLVGYKDDATAPSGGNFLTLDSALNRFDEVPYDFVRTHVADAFWIEAVSTP